MIKPQPCFYMPYQSLCGYLLLSTKAQKTEKEILTRYTEGVVHLQQFLFLCDE